jgi:hypothetical protein
LELPSDLWLDQPDAHERIDRLASDGRLADDEATDLHTFVDEGYLKFTIDLDEGASAEFEADVARVWRERPADLAVSPPGPESPVSFRDYDGPSRPRGYRIPDLHSHSETALDLYLHPKAFRLVELIFGEPALAFQSLYFEHGSQQTLHRDPMFVHADPALHLLASWVALEDVTTESGPLVYVPKSHRLPWFEFSPGSIVAGRDAPREKQREFAQWTQDAMQAQRLEATPFCCRRGDAFLWHPGLLHGGARILDPTLTRRSLVTHYSTAANYRSRTSRMRIRAGDGWRRVPSTTERVITRAGRKGLDNPQRR